MHTHEPRNTHAAAHEVVVRVEAELRRRGGDADEHEHESDLHPDDSDVERWRRDAAKSDGGVPEEVVTTRWCRTPQFIAERLGNANKPAMHFLSTFLTDLRASE